jgi:hypothetical protein
VSLEPHTQADDEASEFLAWLQEEAASFDRLISTENGDWIVKGFIDVFRNVYTIPGDTKVVSKLIELMLFPRFVAFADRHRLRLVLSREQNHYPDLIFVSERGAKFAVDLKSTYRTGTTTVSSMTLGAFTGYFRNRASPKNVTFPYGQYAGHFVLGVIYSRAKARADELRVHTLDDLTRIPSVVKKPAIFCAAEVPPRYRSSGQRQHQEHQVGKHHLGIGERARTLCRAG